MVTLDGWGDGFFSKAYIFGSGCLYREIASGPAGTLPSGMISITPSSHLTIGELYSAFTVGLGFRYNSDEGKVEALAAFGKLIPDLYNELIAGIEINETHFFILECLSKFYVHETFLKLKSFHSQEDIAHTIQKVLEDTVIAFVNKLNVPSDVEDLCLSGGCAANVILNLKVWENTRFKSLHVSPFMSDEGTAFGAAVLSAVKHDVLSEIEFIRDQKLPYWGPDYSEAKILRAVDESKEVSIVRTSLSWFEFAAAALRDNKVLGFFQNRMEFGPRALGNRSIIANPLDPKLRERLNVSMKRRPGWQPFCPIVLESLREEYFESSFHHKHMAIAFRVLPSVQDKIPSAVHVDGTARPQFVTAEDNLNLSILLEEFFRLTGVGCLINTSFNLHGRTIVRSPEDALRDFIDCDMDYLVFPPYLIVERAKEATRAEETAIDSGGTNPTTSHSSPIGILTTSKVR